MIYKKQSISDSVFNNEYIILKIATFCLIDNIKDMFRLSHTNKYIFNIINKNKRYILSSTLNYNIICNDYAYMPKYLKHFDIYMLKLIEKDKNVLKYLPLKLKNSNFLNKIKTLYGNKIKLNNNLYIKIINNCIIVQTYENKQLVFEGEYLNNTMNGRGKIYSNNNLVFDGIFKNNYKNGLGSEYENNIISFYGEYKKGRKEGRGCEYCDGLKVYSGLYKNDDKNGSGITLYNGDKYKCEFLNDNLIYLQKI